MRPFGHPYVDIWFGNSFFLVFHPNALKLTLLPHYHHRNHHYHIVPPISHPYLKTAQEHQNGQSAAIAGLCDTLVKEHASQKFSYVELLSAMGSPDSPLQNMDVQAFLEGASMNDKDMFFILDLRSLHNHNIVTYSQ